MRRRRNRRSVGTVEWRRGVLRQAWRGTDFLAQPADLLCRWRGRYRRHENGRLDRTSTCCLLPGAGIILVDGPVRPCGWLHLRGWLYLAASDCKWTVHSSVSMQPSQATCACRADDSRRHAPQQSQLRRPGRSLSRSRRGRRGRPADEARLRAGGWKRRSVRAPARRCTVDSDERGGVGNRLMSLPHLARASSRCACSVAASSA